MGGGVSLFVCSPHIKQASPFLLPFLLQSWQIFSQSGQKGAKVNKFLRVLGVFSGKSETKNGKNKDIFYFWGLQGLPVWPSLWGGGGVHWVQVVQGAGCRTCRRLALILWWRVPLLLSALSLCLCWVVLEICLYSHFKGVLAGFPCWMWVCIASMLCVACGAFVCVCG